LGLSKRGITALTAIGLIDQIMAMTIPMHGRMIHTQDGKRKFQPYGKDDSQAIYAIKRDNLTIALMDAGDALPNVRFSFNKRCVRLDKECGTITFQDEQTGEQQSVTADLIVGADGIF